MVDQRIEPDEDRNVMQGRIVAFVAIDQRRAHPRIQRPDHVRLRLVANVQRVRGVDAERFAREVEVDMDRGAWIDPKRYTIRSTMTVSSSIW